MKNSSGKVLPSFTMRAAPKRMSQRRPGVSNGLRFTNSWNIIPWCASSMTSWYA